MSQYLKPDSELGYIEEQAEIENLKFNNARHSILGCMLGDFDETGAYIVSAEIVKELIDMPKYIVETMDNIEICKGVLKLDKQIAFMVTFEGNKATLSLIEKLNYEANFALNSGTYSNINEYILDTVETSGEINRNAIYLKWNIGNYEGDTVDVFNCDPAVLEKYFGIVNRFKYLLKANQELLEKEVDLEEIEAEYSNEVLSILRRYPKLYEQVMAQIRTSFEEKVNAITYEKPNFTKTFNELLENAIHSNISVLSAQEIEEFNAEKRNAIVNMNIKKYEQLEMENMDNGEETEFSNRIVRFKVSQAYSSQDIDTLGANYSGAYKLSLEKLALNKQGANKSELLKTLAQLGLIEVVMHEKPVGTLVAETVEKVQAKQDGKTGGKVVGKTGGKSTGKTDGKTTGKNGGKTSGKSGSKTTGKTGGKSTKDKASLVTETTKKKKKKEEPMTYIETYGSLAETLDYSGGAENSSESADRKVKRTHTVDINKQDTKVKSDAKAKVGKSGDAEIDSAAATVNKEEKGVTGESIQKMLNNETKGEVNPLENLVKNPEFNPDNTTLKGKGGGRYQKQNPKTTTDLEHILNQ